MELRNSLLCKKFPAKMPERIVVSERDCYYRLYNIKKKMYEGIMEVEKSNFPPYFDELSGISAVKIKHISNSGIENQGIGTALLQAAKKISEEMGCKGNIYLECYNKNAQPEIFYRKQGLEALSIDRTKLIDSHIKYGSPLPKLSSNVNMFFIKNKNCLKYIEWLKHIK